MFAILQPFAIAGKDTHVMLYSVCGHLGKSCDKTQNYHFAPYDLPLQLPITVSWLSSYNSEPFYAVILKSHATTTEPNCFAEGCTDDLCPNIISEEARLKYQKMFPARKVFASRISCSASAMHYTNVKGEFVAVFAGTSEADAKLLLQQIKTKPQFSDAFLRKMQAEVYYGD